MPLHPTCGGELVAVGVTVGMKASSMAAIFPSRLPMFCTLSAATSSLRSWRQAPKVGLCASEGWKPADPALPPTPDREPARVQTKKSASTLRRKLGDS